MKKTIVAAMVAVMLFANSGCNSCVMGVLVDLSNIPVNEALAYMEEKYGEKFEYIGSGGGLSVPGSRNILVSCESLPGSEILVTIESKGNEKVYYDNFMEHYFKEPLKNYLSNIAKNYFDEFTFSVGMGGTSIGSTYPGMELDEYLHNEHHFIRGNIKIGESDEETIREFVYELKRIGIQFWLNILPADEKYVAKYFCDSEDIEIERKK